MINPKFYKLAGWGMIISSFYFTWWPFFVVAVILHNLVTNGGFEIIEPTVLHGTVTPKEIFYLHIFLNILIGSALIIGGRFVIKWRGRQPVH